MKIELGTIDQENYVDKAHAVIKQLNTVPKDNRKNRQNNPLPSTNQIRNLLAMTDDIYNEVVNDPSKALSEDVISRIQYFRVRCYYESGRDKKVENFCKRSNIFNILEELLKTNHRTKDHYILFNRYMEALTAFHRYETTER